MYSLDELRQMNERDFDYAMRRLDWRAARGDLDAEFIVMQVDAIADELGTFE